MGDFRTSIKIEFSMGGFKDKLDMSINWSPDDNGVDRRVTDWLASRGGRGMRAIREAIYESQEERRAHRCRLLFNSVPVNPNSAFGPSKTVFFCETHNMPMPEYSALTADTECPIGRIEAATDEALAKIAAAGART